MSESARPGDTHMAQDRGPVVHEIDAYDLPGFLEVAAAYGAERYGYVVTPNVDNFISLHESALFRDLYAQADYVLLDSRVAALFFRMLHGKRIPVIPGSDLTAALFERVIAPDDRIVLIGCNERQAELLRRRFGLRQLLHHNPPMGFIHDPAAVEACLQFIEAASPFRFCFVAIGNPQGLMVAQQAAARGRARGLGLAIGASVDFLTGKQQRAPLWMQHAGLEWLFRLLRDPRRLAWRYLVRGPKFFAYVGACKLVLRPPPARAAAPAAPAGQGSVGPVTLGPVTVPSVARPGELTHARAAGPTTIRSASR